MVTVRGAVPVKKEDQVEECKLSVISLMCLQIHPSFSFCSTSQAILQALLEVDLLVTDLKFFQLKQKEKNYSDFICNGYVYTIYHARFRKNTYSFVKTIEYQNTKERQYNRKQYHRIY